MPDHGANTRALLVEDDPNIVDLVRSNLAVRGFDTVVSTDGMRALQLLETEEPDIVLLDLMLPEADGFDLCRQIRERSAVAVIVVSARGGERDKVTALTPPGPAWGCRSRAGSWTPMAAALSSRPPPSGPRSGSAFRSKPA